MQKHRNWLSPCLLASLSPCLLFLLSACSPPTVEPASPFLPTAQIALAPSATDLPTIAPSASLVAASPTSAPSETPSATAAPSTTTQPTTEPTVSHDPAREYERQVYALINGLRAENGVPPLAYNTVLTEAARAHSCEQASTGTISHVSVDGRKLAERLPPTNPPWEWPSENIAAGFATPEETVRAWFDEAPPDDWHRRNILATDQRELGVGFCENPSGAPGYSNFVTADFARRTDLFPLVLNNGAPTSSSPSVRYWLYGAGWADAMRLGETPDLGALSWQPFAPDGTYAVSGSPGQHIVYAELRGPEGATQVVSATITLSI